MFFNSITDEKEKRTVKEKILQVNKIGGVFPYACFGCGCGHTDVRIHD
jgi:hypothetical protein